MSVVPVYAAVRAISGTLASMPIRSYRVMGDGSRQPIPNPPAVPTDGTRVQWVQQMTASALLRGAAAGLVSGMRGGWPTDVRWINPSRVQVDSTSGVPRYLVDGRRVDDEEIIYIPTFTLPGSFEGLSPIRYFAMTIAGGYEAQSASHSWSKNRAIPGIKLKNNAKVLNPTESKAIKDRAMATIRTGEPFVSGTDWDLDVLTMPPGDAAFLQSIKATATQVAAIYRIPPEEIGGESGGSLTYNTVEGNQLRFMMNTIREHAVRFEDALSARLMPRPQRLQFNLDAMIRVDTSTRYQTYRTAREIGLLSIDEIRELEDRRPLPNGQGQDFAPLASLPKEGTE